MTHHWPFVLGLVAASCGSPRSPRGAGPQVAAPPDAGPAVAVETTSDAAEAPPARPLLFDDGAVRIEHGACDGTDPTDELCVTRQGVGETWPLPAGFDIPGGERAYLLGAAATDDGRIIACNGRWLAIWEAGKLVVEQDVFKDLWARGILPEPEEDPPVFAVPFCSESVVTTPLHRTADGALEMTFEAWCGHPHQQKFEQDVALHLDGFDGLPYWEAIGDRLWDEE